MLANVGGLNNKTWFHSLSWYKFRCAKKSIHWNFANIQSTTVCTLQLTAFQVPKACLWASSEAEANPTETHRCVLIDQGIPASKWSILSQVVMSFVGHKGPASIAWWYCMSTLLSPLIEVKVHQEYRGDSYQEDNVKKNRTLKRKWISMTQRHGKKRIRLWSAAKSLCSYLGKQIDKAIRSYCESHMQISSHWISGQEGWILWQQAWKATYDIYQ